MTKRPFSWSSKLKAVKRTFVCIACTAVIVTEEQGWAWNEGLPYCPDCKS